MTITCFPTGSTLGPEVQIKVQVLHHVSQLAVVGILSELTVERIWSEQRQSRGLGNAHQQLFTKKKDFSVSDGSGRNRARQRKKTKKRVDMRSVFKI